MLSEYFEELYKAYRSELEDLETDSEGKNVLAGRLAAKRSQLAALLPMMAMAPEMVAPVFHGACTFRDAHVMVKLSFTEPDDFPEWNAIAPTIDFESWAQKHVALVLAEAGGEQFLIAAVCLEFLHERKNDRSQLSGTRADFESNDNDDGNEDRTEGDDQDLDEAGADWLADQGFDRRG